MSQQFDARRRRAKRPCPIWVDAFLRDTQDLEADEVGAYFLLITAMWSRPSCDLPDNDRKLARIARVSVRLWRARIRGSVLALLTVEDGAIWSKKLRQEASLVEAYLTKQHDRRKGSGGGDDAESGAYALPEGAQLHSQENGEESDKPLKNNESTRTAVEPRSNRGDHHSTPYSLHKKVETDVSTHTVARRASPITRFDEFWSIFPHRNGKKTKRPEAEKKYRAAVRRGIAEETIIAAALAYREDPDVVRGYGRGPVPWLNQEGWADAPAENPVVPMRPAEPERESYADRTRRLLREEIEAETGNGPPALGDSRRFPVLVAIGGQ